METIRINLGCGDQRLEGYTGLDLRPSKGADVLCDFNKPLPLACACVDEVYCKSVLEHIEKLEELLLEVKRILKPGSRFYIYVPHWSNPFYYSDYTHRRFFGLATFDYLVPPPQQMYRKVPVYLEPGFGVDFVRLIFFSPFRLLNLMMKAFQKVTNLSRGTQLFYEYHLSSLVPCYALEYRLHRLQPHETPGEADR